MAKHYCMIQFDTLTGVCDISLSLASQVLSMMYAIHAAGMHQLSHMFVM